MREVGMFRRRRLLIKMAMQFRFLRMVLIAMLAPTIFVSACLYYFIFYLLAQQLAIPESIAYNLIPVIKKINFTLLVGFPLLVALILLWGLILSHRYAGPIYRLEKELDSIAEGNFNIRIKLRKHDELISIADRINKVLDKVQSELQRK